MKNDPYAKDSNSRDRAYREAYSSDEAQEWIASLRPEQRQRAAALGLLKPLHEHSSYEIPLYEERIASPAHHTTQAFHAFLSQFERGPRKMRALHTLLHRKKQRAGVIWAAMRYLCGDGTCELHANRFGITRQAFHSICVKIQKYLTRRQ